MMTAHATRAKVVHCLPGRVRLRVPGHRHDAAYLHRVADHLRAEPHVQSVQVTSTGSLLIQHNTTFHTLLDHVRDAGLDLLTSEVTSLRTLSGSINESVGAVNRWLSNATGGQLTVPVALAATFATMAVVQAIRGYFWSSGAHLLLFALHAATVNSIVDSNYGELALGAVEVAA